MRRYLAALAASALLLAACDADSDVPPTEPSPPTDVDDGVDGQDLDEPEPDAAPPAGGGTAAPDGPLGFEAQLLDGEVVDVAATFGGGPVLLWMWAPW